MGSFTILVMFSICLAAGRRAVNNRMTRARERGWRRRKANLQEDGRARNWPAEVT